ncbi:DNA polymerase Y family protein [Acidiferrobacter sp.]|uniref:Y-family DNA polymerase n=1 Tax=Acidiferrobacter sp. TaxID=1872107 RepID=UPI0026112EBB|nr:DNA polymerase Y family protein [Acidiferrobacter sp.]
MLWLAVVLTALPLEAFAARPAPFAVVEDKVLVACDARAQAQGLVPGLSVVRAHALCPSLSLGVRDRLAETTLLEGLAAFAYGFSPCVVLHADGVLMRFTDEASPLGDPHLVVAHVTQGLADMGCAFEIAMAPTAALAWLCARSAVRCVWTSKDPWRLAVRSLPLTGLSLTDEVRAACQALGLTRLGDLLDLPRPGLIRRFGREVVWLLEGLMGERPEIEDFWAPAPWFRRRLSFSHPVETDEALVFALARIVREWVMVLRAQEARAAGFAVEMTCEDGSVRSEAFTLTRPERDAQILMRLVRERLRDFRPGSAITAVTVSAPLEASTEGSLPLWRDGQWREQDFRGLLDRLQARLGRDSVRALSLHPDHRPERASREASWPPRRLQGPPAHVLGDRPIWLLDPPERLDVVRGMPMLCGPLRLVRGPERVETGWWDEPVVRDYFVAISSRHESLWIFHCARGEWFLHGYFA